MTTSETTRLRALLEAAALPACEAHYDGAMGEWSVHGADGERVADVRWHGVEPWPGDGPVTEARAKLCAALPTVLPGLLDEADRLRAELRDARADLAALTALRPRDPRRTGHRCACCGREGAPDEDGLCPWCDGDIAREQELETLRARLHRARDVVEQIPMYLGATWWGQQLRAAMCEEATAAGYAGGDHWDEGDGTKRGEEMLALVVATARREGAEARLREEIARARADERAACALIADAAKVQREERLAALAAEGLSQHDPARLCLVVAISDAESIAAKIRGRGEP